ncbi:Protein abruptlike, partial [Caligus rogercresseyi]
MGSISGNSTNPGGSLAPAEEEFCLRWNDFRDSIASSLLELRRDKELLDVSLLLSDSDTLVSAHRVVLSACSSFFRSLLLKKGLGPNPVIVLSDVSSEDLDSVLTFMYNGEVKVKQEDLNSFLGVAEKLRVRGLCQGDKRSSAPNK